MKTSNIIITGAIAAYLLFVGLSAASQLDRLDDSYPYARILASGLDTTRIHTVIAEGDGTFILNTTDGNNSLRMAAVPTRENVRIVGDTLYTCPTKGVSIHLPELENFILNGKEQRLPTEEEWQVTYRYDKAIDSLLINN